MGSTKLISVSESRNQIICFVMPELLSVLTIVLHTSLPWLSTRHHASDISKKWKIEPNSAR